MQAELFKIRLASSRRVAEMTGGCPYLNHINSIAISGIEKRKPIAIYSSGLWCNLTKGDKT